MNTNGNRVAAFFCAVVVFVLKPIGAQEPVHASVLKGQPNIVVIMADDLGWRDVHCYGNARLDTPALDQLADEGMRFTDAYAAAPVCSPTRAAMMTGQTPGRLHLTNHAPGHKDGFSLEGSRTSGGRVCAPSGALLRYHRRTPV